MYALVAVMISLFSLKLIYIYTVNLEVSVNKAVTCRFTIRDFASMRILLNVVIWQITWSRGY